MNVNDYLTNTLFNRAVCERRVLDIDVRSTDTEYIEYIKRALFDDLADLLAKQSGFVEEIRVEDMTHYRLTAFVFSQKEIRTLITDAYNAGVFHSARIKDYLHD